MQCAVSSSLLTPSWAPGARARFVRGDAVAPLAERVRWGAPEAGACSCPPVPKATSSWSCTAHAEIGEGTGRGQPTADGGDCCGLAYDLGACFSMEWIIATRVPKQAPPTRRRAARGCNAFQRHALRATAPSLAPCRASTNTPGMLSVGIMRCWPARSSTVVLTTA